MQRPPLAAKLAQRPPDEDGQVDADELHELAEEFPQLWKGAQIHRFTAIPPHYQFVTIPFERAGIVVSDGTSALHDDLPRRHLADRPELFLADNLTLALIDDAQCVVLQLTHPLI